MTDSNNDILQATLNGLETSLHVWHIASKDLRCCDVNDDADRVLALMGEENVDQVPVKDGDHIVGVCTRAGVMAGGRAREQMQPLSDGILVSANAPIERFIQLAEQSKFRLVVHNAQIRGIVTRSDLQALPVRIFIFTLVTHLEMTMANVIRVKCVDDEYWLRLLSPSRQQKVLSKLDSYRHERLDPSPLEFTDFCDKRDIVKKICDLGQRFEEDLKEIEDLRNTVAHAGNYAESDEALRTFVRRIDLTRSWIDCLRKYTGPENGAAP